MHLFISLRIILVTLELTIIEYVHLLTYFAFFYDLFPFLNLDFHHGVDKHGYITLIKIVEDKGWFQSKKNSIFSESGFLYDFWVEINWFLLITIDFSAHS